MNREELKAILDYVRGQEDLKPRNGLTYCNIALDRVLIAYGAVRMINRLTNQPHLANSMVDTLNNSPTRWTKINGYTAHSYANLGALVVSAQKNDYGHGHVAPVYPSESMGFSPSWGKDVPYLSNVGKKNGIYRASQCYHKEPDYFVWKDPNDIVQKGLSMETISKPLGASNGANGINK